MALDRAEVAAGKRGVAQTPEVTQEPSDGQDDGLSMHAGKVIEA
jgi:hypothetical protein